MTLKSAAVLAFVATLLLTLVLAFDFINALLAAMRDLVPMMAVLRALIYLLAGLGLTIFFYVFQRRQS